MSIERIYHPFYLWEEVEANMWGKVKDKSAYEVVAVEFTGNHKIYGENMQRVVKEWKYSCEHNLSNLTQNRKAWIGHAACALAFGCPEDIVRSAWAKLSEKQQIDANEVAEIAIKQWEESHKGAACQKQD